MDRKPFSHIKEQCVSGYRQVRSISKKFGTMYSRRRLGVKLIAEKDTDKIMGSARVSWLKAVVYKMGSQFFIDRKFPLHLYLELSRICNFQCPMCMRKKATSGKHFPEELAKKIVSEAACKGPTNYSLHLFGEPLANPKWDNIVATIRNAHPDNGILLTTNGFFMNEACCQRLIELKVNRIFVSIHSLNPDTYRRKTGGGDISVVLNNIRTFAKLAERSGKSKLFLRLFLGPNDPPFEESQFAELRALGVFFEIRGYHNFAGGKVEWTTFKRTVERWPCFHPWFTLGVAVDGRTLICCADVRFGLDVGNAFNQTIESIWKSEAVESIRQEHLSNNFEQWTTCGPCDAWQFHPDIFFNFQKSLKSHLRS